MSTAATPLSPIAPASDEIDAPALRSWMTDGRAVVVDVREPDEYAKERIPGAVLHPLSRFDPAKLPTGRTVVLHCASGRRSAEAAARARSAGRTDVVQLQGGIGAWKSAGLPVEGNPRLPISIMRQVQLTAGGLVLIGTVLGAFVSVWFLALAGFIGAGLMVAGGTGTCGMASMLRMMPWNRAYRNACGAADGACAGGG